MIINTGAIIEEFMNERNAGTKKYRGHLLKHGFNWNMAGYEKIIREHGRSNFALYASGLMPIVCPIPAAGIRRAAVHCKKKRAVGKLLMKAFQFKNPFFFLFFFFS
ncbi:MAG: hypothetical protein ABI416_16070 [Ginsengibacter sp.]